ncbi:MAG TPA: hypothetical protein VFQ35_09540 [Polyangiaceae bacterium]|nr:hypothetical protein [Polyangiaceae bacterium]
MARTRTATLAPDCFPDVTALNLALKNERLRVVVDPEWGDAEHNGYVACALDGEDAGFEIARKVSSEGKLVLNVRWGGDRREQAAALGVLSVLASRFGAEVSEPEESKVCSAEELGAQAKSLIQALSE